MAGRLLVWLVRNPAHLPRQVAGVAASCRLTRVVNPASKRPVHCLTLRGPTAAVESVRGSIHTGSGKRPPQYGDISCRSKHSTVVAPKNLPRLNTGLSLTSHHPLHQWYGKMHSPVMDEPCLVGYVRRGRWVGDELMEEVRG